MSNTFHSASEQITGFAPAAATVTQLRDWFSAYDDYSARAQVEAMADVAVFPLNLVTDGSDGNAWAGQWSRDEFVAAMSQMNDATATVTFASERTPLFLTECLAVVFTRSTMSIDGTDHHLKYADVMVSIDGCWSFQTMIQGGWADQLAAHS